MRYFSTGNVLFRRFFNAQARDPGHFFFRKSVQQILLDLNEKNADIVLRRRKLKQKIETSVYKFMTEEQLAEAQQKVKEQVIEQLQPPPVLRSRCVEEKRLSYDTDIAEALTQRYICVDTSDNVNHQNRVVVVREKTGELHLASMEERRRTIQQFMPVPFREVYVPPMFEEQHLKPLMERGDYVFILDRACVQFEPDDSLYETVVSAVYDHVDRAREHDKLQSTRHYGSLVFFLAWNRRIDTLLLDKINEEKIECASKLVRLHNILHSTASEAECSEADREEAECSEADREETEGDGAVGHSLSEFERQVAAVKDYIENKSVNRAMLQVALTNYLHLVGQRELVQRDILHAHGHG